MTNPHESRQDEAVMALLAQFDIEYHCAFAAMQSVPQDPSQQRIASAHLDTMSDLYDALIAKVGSAEATRLIIEHMDTSTQPLAGGNEP
jgi:hypothetical protein